MAELFIRNSSVGFIKSFIFDKDGTLLNSEESLIELARTRLDLSINKFSQLKVSKIKIFLLKRLLISLYGLNRTYLSANAITAIASRNQNIISTATIFSLFGFDWSKSLAICQQIFDEADIFLANQRENIQKPKLLISGAFELLVSLKDKGVQIALMSNDTKAGIEEFITQNKLDGLFDYIWSSENKPSKPNPMAVIELCKKMNLQPFECALLSDADTDLKMGKEADIPIVIGFTGGWRNPPFLYEKQFLIKELNELKIQIST